MRTLVKYIYICAVIAALMSAYYGCNYASHRTLSKTIQDTAFSEDPEPDYDISLDENYQDFVSFMYMGNRSESFGTYFNKFYTAEVDYEEALTEYKSGAIAFYNRRLDSLNLSPSVQQSVKDKFTNVIKRCSKVIQYNKNTKYLDDAVLLIGKSYYYSSEFLAAERKFNEFLSKLTKSSLYDEAILYLGRTKFRLGLSQDGETILKNLLKTTEKKEIKSDIYQELAYNELTKKNYSPALEFLKFSVENATDNEAKAEKHYLLGKLYSLYDPKNAPAEYELAYKTTSNFELEFYSKLNQAKALNQIKDHNTAYDILYDLNKRYLDYPELKQLVELETGNTYFYRKEYKLAKDEYFNIIVKHSGSKSAADSYYMLGRYFEEVLNDYLLALVSFKKVSETNTSSDYAEISRIKTNTYDKYFTLQASLSDTTKSAVPEDIPELIKFRQAWEEEQKKLRFQTEPNKEFSSPKGGGSGAGTRQGICLPVFYRFTGVFPLDTIPTDTANAEMKRIIDSINAANRFLDSLNGFLGTGDSVLQRLNDTMNMVRNDSIQAPFINEDSIRLAKENAKLSAYYEMAELFLYSIGNTDSTIYYLNLLADITDSEEWKSRALFTLGTVYKTLENSEKAEEYFRLVIKEFPDSDFANEARKNLGLNTIESSADPAENIYRNAVISIEDNDREKAVNLLYEILEKHPSTPLMPKVLYSLGWVYENMYLNKDSSLYYYNRLKNSYPASEYAMEILPKIAFYESLDKKDTVTAVDSVSKLPTDSLITPDSVKITGDPLDDGGEIEQKPDETGQEENQSGEPTEEHPEFRKQEEQEQKQIPPKEIRP